MTVHYIVLAFAVLLLWFPRNWLRLGKRITPERVRKFDPAKLDRDPSERAVKPLQEATKSRNWIDLFRGAVGAYGVAVAAIVPPGDVLGAHPPTMLCIGAILALSVVFQMIRIESRLSLFAPIFFLQGVAIGVAGPLVGALAMVGSWALTPVLPGAGAILFVQGGIALSLGLLMQESDPPTLMILAGVTWLPVLTSVLLRKRLSATLDKKMKIMSRGSRSVSTGA